MVPYFFFLFFVLQSLHACLSVCMCERIELGISSTNLPAQTLKCAKLALVLATLKLCHPMEMLCWLHVLNTSLFLLCFYFWLGLPLVITAGAFQGRSWGECNSPCLFLHIASHGFNLSHLCLNCGSTCLISSVSLDCDYWYLSVRVSCEVSDVKDGVYLKWKPTYLWSFNWASLLYLKYIWCFKSENEFRHFFFSLLKCGNHSWPKYSRIIGKVKLTEIELMDIDNTPPMYCNTL